MDFKADLAKAFIRIAAGLIIIPLVICFLLWATGTAPRQ